MIEIKKLQALKKQANYLLSQVDINNPVSSIAENYVSRTGLTKSDISDKIDKIKSCCSVVELSASYTEVDHVVEQVMNVVNANFCKQHAVCPVCADHSQNRRRARYNEPIKEQASLVKEGKRYAYILTFTIKDGDSLAERLANLKQSKLEWRKMGQKRKKGFSNGEAKKIKAGLSTIEIKRGQASGLWHVHAHELIFTDSPLDYQVYDQQIKKELQKKFGSKIPKDVLKAAAIETATFNGEEVAVSKISKEWLKATGGESISIDVEPLQHIPRNASYKKQRKCAAMSFEQSIAYQAKEVLKYISKASDNTPEDMLEIITDTYNKRMVATYGEFRGVPGNDYEIESKVDSENYVIVWDAETQDYIKPIPGRMQDFQQEETDTRKKVAQMLGQYRRERRNIISGNEDTSSMAERLDMLKMTFKESVSKVWQFYRNKIRREKDSKDCDNYNPVVALQGLYIQATSEDLYDFAF
jgi:hypothetical protein